MNYNAENSEKSHAHDEQCPKDKCETPAPGLDNGNRSPSANTAPTKAPAKPISYSYNFETISGQNESPAKPLPAQKKETAAPNYLADVHPAEHTKKHAEHSSDFNYNIDTPDVHPQERSSAAFSNNAEPIKKAQKYVPYIIGAAALFLVAIVIAVSSTIFSTPKVDKTLPPISSSYMTSEASQATASHVNSEYIASSQLQETDSNVAVYHTFFNFYSSYLNAINQQNANLLEYCIEDIIAIMPKRLELNKDYTYNLISVTVDQNSLQLYEADGYNCARFTTKCITNVYKRSTGENAGDNVAVWQASARWYPEYNQWVIADFTRMKDAEFMGDNNTYTMK